jgi:hypothetical protein
MCRVDVNLKSNEENKENNSTYCWNIIDINYNEYLKERNALFQSSLEEILKLEEYPK